VDECVYSTSLGSCIDDPEVPDCDSLTEGDCLTTDGCTYASPNCITNCTNLTQTQCEQAGECAVNGSACETNCSSLTQGECGLYEDCYFSNLTDSCEDVPDVPSCSGLSQTVCASTSGCTWNGSSCITDCDALSMLQCELAGDCVYNTVSDECEPIPDLPNCTALSPIVCAVTDGCYFNGTSCVTNCSELTITQCEASADCYYSTINQSCLELPELPECTGLAETSCELTSGCEWNGTGCVIDCDGLTLGQCENAADCYWSTVNDSCGDVPPLPECSGLAPFVCMFTDGCFYTGSKCNTNCSQLTQPQCEVSADCRYADGSCVIDCTSLSNTDCESWDDCFISTFTGGCENPQDLPNCTGLTQTQCASTDGCAWNGTGCETNCSTLTRLECDYSTECYYSELNDSCIEQPDLPNCTSLTQTQCGSTAGCAWNGTACGTNCTNLTQNQCELEGECYYSVVNSTCYDQPDLPNCTGLTQTQCGSTAGCEWNGTDCEVNCSSLTVTQCEASGDCHWSAATDSCVDEPEVPECGELSPFLCVNTDGCYFDGTDCVVNCTNLTLGQCEVYSACYWSLVSDSCQDVPTIPSCEGLTQSQCAAADGCFWDGSECLVNCTPLSLSECETAGDCYWSLISSTCEQVPDVPDCDGLTQTVCGSTAGCGWNGSACEVNCSTLTLTQCETVDECYYSLIFDSCRDTPDVPQCDGLTQTVCDSTSGCSWNGTTCLTNCSSLTLSECEVADDCEYNRVTGECEQEPDIPTCSGLPQAQCEDAAGCVYNGVACVLNCSNLTLIECQSAQHCYYNTVTDSCEPTPDLPECAGLGPFECASTNGCTFNGTDCVTDCVELSLQQCIASQDCLWSELSDSCIDDPDLPGCDGLSELVCNATSGCLYNGSDCVTNCSTLTLPQCDASLECFWSQVSDSCEDRPDVPDCGTIAQAQCDPTVGCEWSGGECVTDCSELTTAQCENSDDCYYSNLTSSCRDEPDPINCTGLTETQCDADSDCMWNGVACTENCSSLSLAECEQSTECYYNGSSCERNCSVLGQFECGLAEDCFWSSTSSSCEEEPDLPECTGLTQTQCGSTAGCGWNGSACETNCTNLTLTQCDAVGECTILDGDCVPECGDLTQAECDASADCVWSSTLNSCEEKPELPSCTGLTQTVCDSTSGCEWNGTGCEQNCSALTLTQCDLSGECFYSTQDGECTDIPDVTNCTGLTQTQCEAEGDCLWNGTGCETNCSSLNSTQCESLEDCLYIASNDTCVDAPDLPVCSGLGVVACLATDGCVYDGQACMTNCSELTQPQCDASLECFFDGSECVVGCGDLPEVRCNLSDDCFENSATGDCENIPDLPNCTGLTQTQCESAAGCGWNGSECELNCSSLNVTLCDYSTDCYYNTINDSCNDVPDLPECSGYGESVCPLVSGCEWNGSACVTDCDLLTQGECEASDECFWSTLSDSCENEPEVPECAGLSQSQCDATQGCIFDGLQCVTNCSMLNITECEVSDECYYSTLTDTCENEPDLPDCDGLSPIVCAATEGCVYVNNSCEINCTELTVAQCEASEVCHYFEGECTIDCERLTELECANESECYWSAVNDSCTDVPDLPDCTGLAQIPCEAALGCSFNGTNCTVECSELSQPQCEVSADCYFSNLTDSCEDEPPLPNCTGLTQTPCGSADGCLWNGTDCQINCTGLELTECEQADECFYNTVNDTCEGNPELPECDGLAELPCEATQGCEWNGTDCNVDCSSLNVTECQAEESCYYSTILSACRDIQEVPDCDPLNGLECAVTDGCFFDGLECRLDCENLTLAQCELAGEECVYDESLSECLFNYTVGAPENLNISYNSDGTVTLLWDAAENASHYTIYYGDDPCDFTFDAMQPQASDVTATMWTDSAAASAPRRLYTVGAVNGGSVALSSTVAGKWDIVLEEGYSFISIPLQPVNPLIKPFSNSIFTSLHEDSDGFGPTFSGSYEFVIGPVGDANPTLSTFRPELPEVIPQNLKQISEEISFYVKMIRGDTLTVVGFIPKKTEVPFIAGNYYWAGFPSCRNKAIKPFSGSVLYSLHDGAVRDFGPGFDGSYEFIVGPSETTKLLSTFRPELPPVIPQNLNNLTINYGYIFKINKDDTFVLNYV